MARCSIDCEQTSPYTMSITRQHNHHGIVPRARIIKSVAPSSSNTKQRHPMKYSTGIFDAHVHTLSLWSSSNKRSQLTNCDLFFPSFWDCNHEITKRDIMEFSILVWIDKICRIIGLEENWFCLNLDFFFILGRISSVINLIESGAKLWGTWLIKATAAGEKYKD